MAERNFPLGESTVDCQQVELDLPWLMNGTLEDREKRLIREHLIRCPRCRRAAEDTRGVFAIVERAADVGAAAFEANPRPQVMPSPSTSLKWAATIVMSICGAALVATMLPGLRNSKMAQKNSEISAHRTYAVEEVVVFADGFENLELDGWVVYGAETASDLHTQ